MFRCLFKLVFGVVIVAGIFLYLWLGGHGGHGSTTKPAAARQHSLGTAQTWANPASLPDHFARHGADFGARNPEDYARLAAQFLQRAKAEGLPAKVDNSGVLRIYDSRSGSFGAYNADGTTKTFFKPGSAEYFDRQPGRPVNLKTWR